MRRGRGLTVALVASAAAGCGGAADAPGPREPASAAPVLGRVLDHRGAPVPGARVTISRAGSAFEAGRAVARAATGAGGRFRVAAAPAAATHLEVSARGHASARRDLRDAPLAGPVTVRLPRGAVVTGTVLGRDRRPAPAAAVRAGDVTTRADARGRFVLRGVEPGIATVEARLADLVAVTEVGARDGRRAGARLTLVPSGAVRGVVRDAATGRPVPGAVVMRLALTGSLAGGAMALRRPPRPGETAVADRRGRFALAGVPPGEAAVTVSRRGYAPPPPRRVAVGPGQRAGVALALEPLRRVTGRVLDAAGRPLAGAVVSAAESPATGELAASVSLAGGAATLAASSDTQGRFSVFVPRGAAQLVATARGHAPRAAGIAPGGVRMRLRPAALLEGLVTGAGRPVEGATVRAWPLEERPAGIAEPEPAARSGPGGRFRLTELGPGAHSLEISAPGFVARGVVARLPPRGSLRVGPLRLRADLPARGRLLGAGGEPLAGASVIAYTRGGRRESRATTDAEGRFVLRGLPPGARASVDAYAAGYERASGVVAAPRPLRLRTRPTGRLVGHVVDARTGRPVAGYRVAFLPPPPRPEGGPVPLPDVRAFFAADGRFRWLDLPAGRWRFEVTAPGYRPAGRRVGVGGRPAVFPLRRTH